jgi:glycerol kinase
VSRDFPDISALGAAYMAAIGAGLIDSPDGIKPVSGDTRIFEPGKDQEKVMGYYEGWKKVIQSMG